MGVNREKRERRKVIQEEMERGEERRIKGAMVPNHSSTISANVMITIIFDTR